MNKDIKQYQINEKVFYVMQGVCIVEDIIQIVAEHFEITTSDLVSQKRSREIAYPRQIYMYLCRKLTDISLQAIAKSLGKKDHTTVLHGINKIEEDLLSDEQLKNTVDVLIKKISPTK